MWFKWEVDKPLPEFERQLFEKLFLEIGRNLFEFDAVKQTRRLDESVNAES